LPRGKPGQSLREVALAAAVARSDSHHESSRCERKTSTFEKYREAWWILTGEKPRPGTGKETSKKPGKKK
jgi:hypothetical protein